MTGVDPARLRQGVEEVAGRVAAIVRPLRDTSRRLPGSEWTVGEAAAHLAWAQEQMAVLAGGGVLRHGDRTRAGLATANAQVLQRYAERDGARLADIMVEATASYFAHAGRLAPAATLDTPMGAMTIGTATSYMLVHLMMHGWPIARAVHKRRPFDGDHVSMGVPFLVHAMPVVLDKRAVGELTACYDLRFRDGPRLGVMFDRGEMTIAPAPTRRADCTILADPVAFFLVACGLVNQWSQIPRGKLLTWGPKPWLALRFAGLFVPP